MAKKVFILFLGLLTAVTAQPVSFRIDKETMHAEPSALSLFNNPVAISSQENFIAAFGQQRGFMLPELDRRFLSVIVPVRKSGVFTAAYQNSGNKDFSQHFVSGGFGRKFSENIAAYAGGWMYSVKQGEGYGSKKIPGASAAFSARLSKSLNCFTLLELPAIKDEIIYPSSVFRSGISVSCSSACTIEASGTLEPGKPFCFAGGIYYKPSEKISFRTGINSAPFLFYGAFSVRFSKFILDLSMLQQPDIGLTPRITIAFETDKKERK